MRVILVALPGWAVMSTHENRRVESLEAWSPTAFLVAGGLFVGFAALWGAGTYTSLSPRPTVDVFGPAGWAAAFVGLLGLSSRFVDRAPWQVRAGAVFAAVGTVGAVVTALVSLGELAGLVVDPPAWFVALNLLLFVGILPGFLTFGVVSLRAARHSRTLGLLLLVPAVVFAVNLVRVGTLGPTTPPWAPAVLGGGQAVALLAIGFALRTDGVPTGRQPSVEVTEG